MNKKALKMNGNIGGLPPPNVFIVITRHSFDVTSSSGETVLLVKNICEPPPCQ